mmetsp:Transcript_22147/g.46196  ORF Transcript_22147/g.46196 Transcript_22147/m.46196 type:complete len:115 (-) Transcript_22147:28-372(-)
MTATHNNPSPSVRGSDEKNRSGWETTATISNIDRTFPRIRRRINLGRRSIQVSLLESEPRAVDWGGTATSLVLRKRPCRVQQYYRKQAIFVMGSIHKEENVFRLGSGREGLWLE